MAQVSLKTWETEGTCNIIGQCRDYQDQPSLILLDAATEQALLNDYLLPCRKFSGSHQNASWYTAPTSKHDTA